MRNSPEDRDRWTDDRKKIVTTLWNEGQSASQIASVFGVSRSSVLGIVHRMGLSKRRGTSWRAPRSKPRAPTKFNFATKAAREKPTSPPEPYVARETIVTAEHERLSFDDLVDGRCKYAHGDTPPYSFCGAKSAAPGVSWCPTHFRAVTGVPHPSVRAAEHSEQTGELEAVS